MKKGVKIASSIILNFAILFIIGAIFCTIYSTPHQIEKFFLEYAN